MTTSPRTVNIDGHDLPCLVQRGPLCFVLSLENGWNVYVAGLRRGEDVHYGVEPLTREQADLVADRKFPTEFSDRQLRLARNIIGEPALYARILELSSEPSPGSGE